MSQHQGSYPPPHITYDQPRPAGPFTVAAYGKKQTPAIFGGRSGGSKDTGKMGGPK